MKKLLALLLLLCLLPLTAQAEMDADGNVIVALDGAEVFFTPIEGYCLTRESSASAFNRLGLSQREIVPWMEEYDVYALLYDEQLSMEIQVSIMPTTDVDFDELTIYSQDMACERVESLYLGQGYEVESVEMYHTYDGHSYVCTMASCVYEDGYVQHVMEFFTCQSGYAVMVVLLSYEGSLTEDQMFQGMSIVESLWLSENANVDADE